MKIAIVGKMRSGKNTVADLLTKQHQYKQLAFGTGIKEIIDIYFPEAWEHGKPRQHYTHIGQELRELNPYVWINYLNRSMEKLLEEDSNTNIIITDCRQKNEEIFLRNKGFIILKVITEDSIRLQRMKEKGESVASEYLNHDTEKQVDLIDSDFIVYNNGTLKDLRNDVNDVYRLILKREGALI